MLKLGGWIGDYFNVHRKVIHVNAHVGQKMYYDMNWDMLCTIILCCIIVV